MKKRMKLKRELVCVVVVVISILISAFALQRVMADVHRVRHNLLEESLNTNSYVYGKYVDTAFTGRVELMSSMADCIAKMDVDNPKELYAVLAGQNLFDRMSIIDNSGNVLCGDDYDGSSIMNEDFYEDLMEGKNALASRSEADEDGKEVLRFFAPVRRESKTVMTIVGSVLSVNIKNILNGADYISDGTICILDRDGDYVMGDDMFESLLGDKENNHFSHINSARNLEGIFSAEELEERMEEGTAVSMHYSYASVNYSAKYVPLSVNGWYLVSTLPSNDVFDNAPVFTTGTKVIAIISLLFSILFIVMALYLIYRSLCLQKEINRHISLEKCDKGVAFQLTFKPHRLEFYGDVKSIIGTEMGILQGEAVYDVYDWVHEDDASLRGRLSSFWESGDSNFKTEVRIRNIKGNYGWYRVVGVLERNIKGNNKCFVGKILNVDQQLSEEKELMQRAENDLLTGVLNKKTMEKRISLMLKNRGGKYVIFYMVDLDHFKNVNDTLGHIYGDQAIVETAQCLNKVFANQDCIGRLGGDEFAICVSYQAFDEQGLLDFIEKKAGEICAVNRRTYTDNVSEVSISSSVGISYAPDMGESFEELYTKADRALYYSKENGRNQYHIYSPEDN